jgi:hypothetical protein
MILGVAKLCHGQFGRFACEPGDRDRIGVHERLNVRNAYSRRWGMCVTRDERFRDPPRFVCAQSAIGRQAVCAIRRGGGRASRSGFRMGHVAFYLSDSERTTHL